MNFTFEKNKLYVYLGVDLVETFKKYGAIIAGGTITSLFNNKEINDLDVYFKSDKLACGFLAECWENNICVTTHTSKATLFLKDNRQIQMIHFKFFESPEDIFKSFDFTVCMGAFDFSTEKFVLHEDFMKHNSQRLLVFNGSTAFPIVSLLRVQKYIGKGYTISKPEFIRIILTCMDLKINTYEELKEQMGGMYGINYDKLFEDDSEELLLSEAVEKIANLSLDEDYFKLPVNKEFDDLDDLLHDINKSPVKTLVINEEKYKISPDGLLNVLNREIEDEEKLDTEEFFNINKFYKFVERKENKLVSFFDNTFEYRIGDFAKAKKAPHINRWDSSGKLFFNEKNAIKCSSYFGRENKVLIEVQLKEKDFLEAEDGTVEATQCYVIREVPEEEWKELISAKQI